jgi:hypothetical protein
MAVDRRKISVCFFGMDISVSDYYADPSVYRAFICSESIKGTKKHGLLIIYLIILISLLVFLGIIVSELS